MGLAVSGSLLVVMVLTTIGIYEVFANAKLTCWLIKLVDKSILAQFMLNFGISYVIMLFTGAGLYAGLANLGASLLFPVYVAVKRKALKIGYKY